MLVVLFSLSPKLLVFMLHLYESTLEILVDYTKLQGIPKVPKQFL